MVCRYPSVPPERGAGGGGWADPDPGAVAGEEARAEQEAETAHHLDRWDTFIWGILWVMQSQGASCLLHFTTQYTYDEFDGIHKMYNKD